MSEISILRKIQRKKKQYREKKNKLATVRFIIGIHHLVSIDLDGATINATVCMFSIDAVVLLYDQLITKIET